MKTVFAFVALLAFVVNPVFAADLTFPKAGEPMFQITIPDTWEPDTDEDEIVEASSPKENVSLSIWEIPSETSMESLVTDLQDILKDRANEVKLDDKPKQVEVSGFPGLFLTGSGVDQDDESELGFVAIVLVQGEKAAILYFEFNDKVSEKEVKKVKTIIESITPATAK